MQRTLRVFRFQPGKDEQPHYDEFTIEVQPAWTVLDALNAIKWHHDGTLTYRRSCRHGICGSCAMMINGKNELACEKQLKTIKGVVVVEPMKEYAVLRDLMVDMEPFFEKLRLVKPWLINHTAPPTDKERLQSPEERKILDGTWECILCGACTSSCPAFWDNESFLGPAALLRAFRYVGDTRDEGLSERADILDSKIGVWRCHSIFNCVEACPKSLNPTWGIMSLRNKLLREKI
ncbi:MAG: succinate dehydrogenase iron-sulfur subunit [Candidatus Eisenbacteria bacterium]|nr:succinate dehydrogenase iron-sulfur subunit [Candidatus Eisenbacteria bacterium]